MSTTTRTDATLTWVCTCCLLKLANDDTSGCEDSCTIGTDDHPARWLEQYPGDTDLTIGMLRREHWRECPNRHPSAGGAYECNCETIDFTSTPCAGCGSHLAGSRHAVTMWTTP